MEQFYKKWNCSTFLGQKVELLHILWITWLLKSGAALRKSRIGTESGKDLNVSLRPESTLPVLTLVDFRQWEQYQIKLSFDFVEEQGVSTIAVEQVEQVMLDFRIPCC